MIGQENLPNSVKEKIEEMKLWQQELEERELQYQRDYQLLDKKITELEELDKYLKTWEANLKHKEQAWNKKKKIETENFTKELLYEKKKLKDQIEVLEDRRTTLNYDIDNKEYILSDLSKDIEKLEAKKIREQKRVDNLFALEKEKLSDKEMYLQNQETKLEEQQEAFSKKVTDKNDYIALVNFALKKKFIVIFTILAFVAVSFLIYLNSYDRQLGIYNKSLEEYNTQIANINNKIDKKENSTEMQLYQTNCINRDEPEEDFVYSCSYNKENDIDPLNEAIEKLEQQKKELVKPQEPKV